MTTFWLIRHGQTDWNITGRIQGSTDIPLNEQGLQQAHAIADTLDGLMPDAIYSSPQIRARKTAEIVAETLGIKDIELDSRLRERNMGGWEGQIMNELRQRYPEEFIRREKDPLHYRNPGSESALEVAERLRAFIKHAFATHPQGKVILVSHGYALSILRCVLERLPLADAPKYIPDNAVPYVIEWPGEDLTFVTGHAF